MRVVPGQRGCCTFLLHYRANLTLKRQVGTVGRHRSRSVVEHVLVSFRAPALGAVVEALIVPSRMTLMTPARSPHRAHRNLAAMPRTVGSPNLVTLVA